MLALRVTSDADDHLVDGDAVRRRTAKKPTVSSRVPSMLVTPTPVWVLIPRLLEGTGQDLGDVGVGASGTRCASSVTSEPRSASSDEFAAHGSGSDDRPRQNLLELQDVVRRQRSGVRRSRGREADGGTDPVMSRITASPCSSVPSEARTWWVCAIHQRTGAGHDRDLATLEERR